MDLRLRLLEVLEPYLAADFMEVVDVQVLVQGRRRTVRLLVDQPGGVSVEDCAAVSRRVASLLDQEDLVPFRYVLEVSSPGLDRPLRKPEHFRRFTGERVHIRMKDSYGPRRQFSGKLLGLDGGVLRVLPDKGDAFRLPLDSVRSARVQIDPWKRRE